MVFFQSAIFSTTDKKYVIIKNNNSKISAELLSDLEKDRVLLDNLTTVRKKQSASAKALVSMIETGAYDLDEFYNHYYFLFPFYRFVPNSNTLEEVLNSSHLRFITDETLKNKLLDLRNIYIVI